MVPWSVVRRAIERKEDAVDLAGTDARSLVDYPHAQSLTGTMGADRDRLAAGVARRILEQVREGSLELRRVARERRQILVERGAEGLLGAVRAYVRDSLVQDILDRVGHATPLAGPRLEQRQVEQLLDQAREIGLGFEDGG